MFLKQSTASQTRIIGPFVDITDFVSPELSLTIANTDIKLSANGGTVANKNSGGGTHISNGNYAVTFDATDSATVGELSVNINHASAIPVAMKFFVLEEAVYDALFAASAAGFATIAALATAQTDLDTLTGSDGVTLATAQANYAPATAAALATVDTVVDGIQTDLDNATDGLGAIKADTAAVLLDTAEIGAAGAGLTALATQASVNTIDDFLDTEIAAIKAVTDLFTAAQVEPTAVPAANATPMAKIAWLAMLARNKITQTATTQLVKADDGTTTVGTSTVSDDATTATRGEFV